MISGYQLYNVYHTTHLHFTTNYDCLKYNGKSKSISEDSFNNRKDKTRFDQWATKINNRKIALDFCVFNFANNEESWFYTEFERANDVYLKTKGYFSSLQFNLKNEFNFLESIKADKDITFKDLVNETKSKNKPPLLQLLLRKNISKEFLCLLDKQSTFINEWKENYESDPLVQNELEILTKYQPFVIINSRNHG